MSVSQAQKDEWLREAQLKDYPYRIASEDWRAGLAAARSVADPSEKCTALAWVAYFAPDNQVEPLASEAFEVLPIGPKHGALLGCAAYPLRALIERGKLDRANELADVVLRRIAEIANRVDRSRALLRVFEALLLGTPQCWQTAFDELRRTCVPVDDWQLGYDLYRAVLLVAGVDHELAERVVAEAPPSHHRRSLENKLSRGDHDSLQSFFWKLPLGLASAKTTEGDCCK